MLEREQKCHRADQRNEMLGAAKPAPGEAFDHQRQSRGDRERREDRQRPRHAGMYHRPGRHAGEHEQPGNAEVEEIEHADAERERDRHHGVDRSEHQAVDDLLADHGEGWARQKMLARSYCTGHAALSARSALAAYSGQYGSLSSMRPSTTRSARSLAMISSAISGDEMRPTAAVAIPASCRMRSANGI